VTEFSLEAVTTDDWRMSFVTRRQTYRFVMARDRRQFSTGCALLFSFFFFEDRLKRRHLGIEDTERKSGFFYDHCLMTHVNSVLPTVRRYAKQSKNAQTLLRSGMYRISKFRVDLSYNEEMSDCDTT
jgi:hypothetical protein